MKRKWKQDIDRASRALVLGGHLMLLSLGMPSGLSAAPITEAAPISDRVVIYTIDVDKKFLEGDEPQPPPPIPSFLLGTVPPPGPMPRDVLLTLPGTSEPRDTPSDIIRLVNLPSVGPDPTLRDIRLRFQSDPHGDGLGLPSDLLRTAVAIRETGQLQDITSLLFPPFVEFPVHFPDAPFRVVLVQSDRPGVSLPEPNFSDRVVIYSIPDGFDFDVSLEEGGGEFFSNDLDGVRLESRPATRDVVLVEGEPSDPRMRKPSDLIRLSSFEFEDLPGTFGLNIKFFSDPVEFPDIRPDAVFILETGGLQDITAGLFPDLVVPGGFRDAPPIVVLVQSDVEGVPGPSTLLLLASGLAWLGAVAWRRQTRNDRHPGGGSAGSTGRSLADPR